MLNVGSEGSPARFPPSTWNDNLQTLRRDHRTNDLCEEWNFTFARRFGHSHPSTWNCIAAQQNGEICSRRTIIQFENGEGESRQNSTVYPTVHAIESVQQTNELFSTIAVYNLHALCVNKNFPVQPLPIILTFGFEESYSAGRTLGRTHHLFHPESKAEDCAISFILSLT